MLRRNHENALEFLLLERALEQLAPGRLSLERKMALRHRIFSRLGPQEVPWGENARELARTRWVAVPAGIGIAAAVISALHDAGYFAEPDRAAPTRQVAVAEFQVIGSLDGSVEHGKRVTARTASWITHGRSVFGLEAGSSIIFREASDGSYHIELLAGELNVATDVARVHVAFGASTGEIAPGGSAKFTRTDAISTIQALRGAVAVSAGGNAYEVSPGDGLLVITPAGPEAAPRGGEAVSGPAANVPKASETTNGPQPGPGLAIVDEAPDEAPSASSGRVPSEVPPPQSSSPGDGSGPAAHAPGPPNETGPGNSQGNPPEGPGGGQSQGHPPEDPGGGQSQGHPPEDPGGGQSQGHPPEDPGGGRSQGNPPEDPGGGQLQGSPPEDPGGGHSQGNPPENPGPGTGGGYAFGPDGNNGNANGPDSNNGNGSGASNGNPPANAGSENSQSKAGGHADSEASGVSAGDGPGNAGAARGAGPRSEPV